MFPNVNRNRGMSSGGPRGLPLALLGLAGIALWKNRNRLSELAQQFKGKLDERMGGSAAPRAETVPDDYDYTRPSVFNSTAAAGPLDGAGEPRGTDGGSMGTDYGTQGLGAR